MIAFCFPMLLIPSCCVVYFSHDLDNILLENLGDVRTLQAVFELEALVLTGINFRYCITIFRYSVFF